MTDSSIEAIDLTKNYGKFTALDSLNLRLEGSKCVGFLGPNGAGKTTTLKIFTDLIKPSRGSALINGLEVHGNKKKALENCSALVETPEIYPYMSAREALNLVADLKGLPKSGRKDMIEEAISEVRMEDWIDAKVGKFSKGMKQRINIASTLIGNPAVIFLDEPTTGLDPRGMAEVRGIVKSLKQKDRLIFMSSHLLNEVSDVCDEVALIDHGKLLAYGTMDEVTARFTGEEGLADASFSRPVDQDTYDHYIVKLDHVISAERVNGKTVRLKFKGGQSAQEEILADLASLKIGLLEFKTAFSKLEDTYMSLIQEGN